MTEWISVEDRLPKLILSDIGEPPSSAFVLTIDVKGSHYIAWMIDQEWFTESAPHDDITHWMPLPRKPE